MPAATMAPAALPQDGKGADSAAVAAARMVIRNANLVMVVTDPAASSDQIAAMASSLGGFTVSSYTYQASTDSAGNKIMQANITVRVPAAQLDSFLAQLAGLAVEVRSKNISGQDVTADYADLDARLRNLEAAEAQLVSIMDKATKTEDVLAVFNQLTYIREQIEQIKGQMKFYAESASLSAVTVELQADVLSQPIEVGGWKIEGVARQAVEALVRAMQGLVTLGVWGIIYLVPLLLVILLPLYLLGRFVVRRTRKPKVTPAA
jgi:hypothetical protein